MNKLILGMTRLGRNPDDERTTSRKKYFWFECGCGRVVSRRSDIKSQSCCEPACCVSTRPRHGGSGTRLHNIWMGIRDRCLYGHKSSVHYKMRGIGICTEWSMFSAFRDWALSNGYNNALTIDRVNIDGNYSPENCEWVTREENASRQIRDNHGPFKTRR